MGYNLASFLNSIFRLNALRTAFDDFGVVIYVKLTDCYITFGSFPVIISEVDPSTILFFCTGSFFRVITAVDVKFFAISIVFDLRKSLFKKLDITGNVGRTLSSVMR